MSKRRHFIHDEYHDGKVNHIFGIFEMIGSLGSSAINKDAQRETNAMNQAMFDEQMAYTKERDKLNDTRYADETAYNRAWAEDDRAYTRALQQEIFNREDTALERQAQSLSSMGINPLSSNMQGLGTGQALSSPSAPSAGNAQHASLPSAPEMKAYTGWNFSGLEPSLDFMNQLDHLHTAGIQRDLMRQQENYQKLVNMAFANDNGIILDKYGNPIGIDKTVTNQEIRQAEQEGRNQDNRSKKANASIDERENEFQYRTGSHKSVTMPAQMAYDATWAAQNAATGIKNAYNNHVDNAKSTLDSKMSTLQDRLTEAGSKLMTNSINTFMNARKYMSSIFTRKEKNLYIPNSSKTFGGFRSKIK